MHANIAADAKDRAFMMILKDAMHVTIVVSDILPAADAMAMKELPALRAMVQVWRWVYL